MCGRSCEAGGGGKQNAGASFRPPLDRTGAFGPAPDTANTSSTVRPERQMSPRTSVCLSVTSNDPFTPSLLEHKLYPTLPWIASLWTAPPPQDSSSGGGGGAPLIDVGDIFLGANDVSVIKKQAHSVTV